MPDDKGATVSCLLIVNGSSDSRSSVPLIGSQSFVVPIALEMSECTNETAMAGGQLEKVIECGGLGRSVRLLTIRVLGRMNIIAKQKL